MDMVGRMPSDILNQDRYVLGGVDVKVKVTPRKGDFLT